MGVKCRDFTRTANSLGVYADEAAAEAAFSINQPATIGHSLFHVLYFRATTQISHLRIRANNLGAAAPAAHTYYVVSTAPRVQRIPLAPLRMGVRLS